MAENSSIEWTTHTFNPWIGCTKVSPGCRFCYAEHLMDTRMGRAKWGRGNPRQRTGVLNWEKPLKWDKRAEQSGKKEKVFCSSLADVFDSEVEQSWRDDLFELIENTPNLDWLLLTKRPENIVEMIPSEWSLSGIPDHVWLGTSVENEEQAQKRIPILSGYDSSVRFLSCEPLLSRLEFKGLDLSRIHWIIAGGESGSGARPMHPQWLEALRDTCREEGIPFFFKQWGAWRPGSQEDIGKAYKDTVLIDRDGREKGLFEAFVPPDDVMMIRVGKKSSGCLLEGVEHKEFPKQGESK